MTVFTCCILKSSSFLYTFTWRTSHISPADEMRRWRRLVDRWFEWIWTWSTDSRNSDNIKYKAIKHFLTSLTTTIIISNNSRIYCVVSFFIGWKESSSSSSSFYHSWVTCWIGWISHSCLLFWMLWCDAMGWLAAWLTG